MEYILDFESNNYSYMEEVNYGVLKQIKKSMQNSTILDVGAGKCSIASHLAALNYEVYAIEKNEKIAKESSEKVNKMICCDITDIVNIKAEIQEKKFKYIIFADILEHIYDPLQVLRDYLPFLEKNGKIIISVPNIVNWQNRIRFMLGNFDYEMTGSMDRTHIRFFTFKSMSKLIHASGCTIEKRDCTPFIIRSILPFIKKLLHKKNNNETPRELINTSAYRFYHKYIYPIEYIMARIFPNLLAFQMIITARACQDRS